MALGYMERRHAVLSHAVLERSRTAWLSTAWRQAATGSSPSPAGWALHNRRHRTAYAGMFTPGLASNRSSETKAISKVTHAGREDRGVLLLHHWRGRLRRPMDGEVLDVIACGASEGGDEYTSFEDPLSIRIPAARL